MAAEKNITRSFFSNSLNIFIIRFLSTLANLMVVIYFSHKLSRFDYGRYGAFWVQLNIGIIIASCGFALIAFTYKPEQLLFFLKQLKKKYYFIYALFVLLCGCAFSFLLQENSITHFSGIRIWIPAAFFVFYTVAFLLETTLIIFRRFIPLLIISIIYPVIFFGLHWYAASEAALPMEWLIQWLLVLVAVKVVVGIAYMTNSIKRLPAGKEAPTVSVKAVKKLWLHLGIYDIAQMVFRSVDKLIISLIASKEALAIYYNGSQDIPFLPVFLASIRSASLIQLSQAGGRSEEAVKISNKAAAILSTIAFAALAYVLCFRYEIIVIVFSEKYIPALQIFVCAMLIIPAQFCCPVFFILQNKQKGAIINQGAILDMVLAILLMIPLYNLWGPVGITISIVIAAYFQTGYYLYHAARALGVPVIALMPLKDWAWKLILFGSINIVAHYGCSRWMTPFYSLVAGGTVTGIIALWLLLKEYRKMNNHNNLVVNDVES